MVKFSNFSNVGKRKSNQVLSPKLAKSSNFSYNCSVAKISNKKRILTTGLPNLTAFSNKLTMTIMYFKNLFFLHFDYIENKLFNYISQHSDQKLEAVLAASVLQSFLALPEEPKNNLTCFETSSLKLWLMY